MGGLAYSQEAKQPISEEQQLVIQMLNFKRKYGAELILTAQLGVTIINYENQIKALQEEIKRLNAKPEKEDEG